jgi:hypothetical protein
MKANRKTFLFIFGILSLVVISLALASIEVEEPVSPISNGEGLTWNTHVVVEQIRDGKVIRHEEGHNTLYNQGKDMVRDLLANGGGGNVTNISLCNATAGAGCGTPTAAATEDYTLFTDIGLASIEGSYATHATNGNWSVYNTFTATDYAAVNVTRLTNVTGSNLSGFYFTVINLENTDQLTINWTVYVT